MPEPQETDSLELDPSEFEDTDLFEIGAAEPTGAYQSQEGLAQDAEATK